MANTVTSGVHHKLAHYITVTRPIVFLVCSQATTKIAADVGAYGRQNDSSVFNNSYLGK
jgi:hypothetical protein